MNTAAANTGINITHPDDATSLHKELLEISLRRSKNDTPHNVPKLKTRRRRTPPPPMQRNDDSPPIVTVLPTRSDNDNNNVPLFLTKRAENADLNQYWYSSSTVRTFKRAILERGGSGRRGGGEGPGTVAFLSTPSLFFSFSEEERRGFVLFDYDESLHRGPSFVHYDYNYPVNISPALHHAFDMVVIDPPFITSDVWKCYKRTSDLILKDKNGGPGGQVLATTVCENEGLMRELFNARMAKFRPSIPHLVYQYETFINFESSVLESCNDDIM
mmetsp:Transcript_64277/g.76086  ORF Transcript_64277/g.76086 Transcript_64277/m.76086 type:complete len:273 (-) Transcript_64277:112-930(-)|eukprot:CAMPEP_0172485338 /NCGR_PEP_ID=MMETSP1066-20121228/13373_1 /TAXON_ID=671091 /ORGANISM="Coscinodiscus wailesii, Strain CCMP2513" /LENGTH=272 /DNA_ID=CAMNT_0013250555 /DNA_START=89 /DNA_END=907 /DNA_ORIENTATION=+